MCKWIYNIYINYVNLLLCHNHLGQLSKLMLVYFVSAIHGFVENPLMRKIMKRTSKFPLAPMGVLAPGSGHARPSA